MGPDVSPPRVSRFGLFELDHGSGELLREGRRVKLQDQPFRVLTLLLERPGQVVTRDELRQALWPSDTFVDFEDGLHAAVRKLRAALGDSPDNPTFVETIPRKGYRFIAPVTMAGDAAMPSARPDDRTAGASGPERRTAVWLAVAAVTIAGAAILTLTRSRGASPTDSAAVTPIRSIVVLPLMNLSNDPEQQYFADGMTEELITRLAALEGLRVISRTSAMRFRDSEKLLPQIAAELNVDAVVEGSVLRSGDRVRISAQLVHAATDRHLWAESFERDERDVLALQHEVASEIARKIRVTLRPRTAATSLLPLDPEAHRAYLRGRYRWHTRRGDELLRAVDDFKRAIALESGFALAHAGLADTYLVLPFLTPTSPPEVYPRARAAAAQALALDPSLAEAHNSDAYVRMYLDWDFAGAERGFRKAIEVNPNYATAHQWYAELLSFQRRHDEALAELGIALALDPLAAVMHHQAGQSLQQARRYDEAIQEYENAIALDPWFLGLSGHAMVSAYLRNGMLPQAAEALKRAYPGGKEIAADMATAAARGDVRGFRLKQLELVSRYHRPACHMAPVLAALGRDDEALRLLEEASARRDECILYSNVDPEWDHLRSHPRFVAVQRTIGLGAAATPATPRL